MSHEPAEHEFLLTNIKTLYTLAGSAEPRRGADMQRLEELHDAAVHVRSGRIVEVDERAPLETRHPTLPRLDLEGKIAVPAFVDAHTHPVFAFGRANEFEMRLRGATYVEIAQSGGGILSSVRGVRETSQEELEQLLLERFDRFLTLGTTAIEAKSGYGLSVEDELKSLRALRGAAEKHGLHVEPTFLGAHEVPPEFRDRRSAYVDLVCEEMIPRVCEEKLARFCDVFTEGHVFSLEESRKILEVALDHGMELRLHADQLSPLGGTELAIELGATSADHLDWVSDEAIERLAGSRTIPVLLPGVSHFLRIERDAPARRLIDHGVPVAVATDMNPGSCYTFSLPMVMHLACLRMNLTPAEALTAATINAAHATGVSDERGSIEPGKVADLVTLDVPDYRFLTYEFARNPVHQVLRAGQVVYRASVPQG